MFVPFQSGVSVRDETVSIPPPSRVDSFPRRELAKGDSLYRAGDPATTVYLVEEGLFKLGIDVLTGKERIVAVVGPGDFVGALAPGQPVLKENAEALSPRVGVRVMPLDALDEPLREAVHAAAGVQLGWLREALEDGELPVTARLARTLLRLGERFGQNAEDRSVRLTLPLTHENFAAMVGAARETTTATLGELRSNGLLRGTRGRYSFRPEALREVVLESALS